MSLRRRNSGVAVAGVASHIARFSFLFSASFFFLALMFLLFVQVGAVERVIYIFVLWINGTIAIGSVFLMRYLYKSDEKFKKALEENNPSVQSKTIDDWLTKKDNEQNHAGNS